MYDKLRSQMITGFAVMAGKFSQMPEVIKSGSTLNSAKGFTLLELLIVIAILAVLATATILVLNPAELLRQARDTQRQTDISSLNSALSLYLTSASTTPIASSTGALSNATCRSTAAANGTCYSDRSGGFTALVGASPSCGGRYTTATGVTSTNRQINAGGWLPVAFSNITGGSPMGILPTDPTNDYTRYYAYACNDGATASSTYVLTAAFESTKFNAGTGPAATDVVSSSLIYERGNNPGLNSSGSGM